MRSIRVLCAAAVGTSLLSAWTVLAPTAAGQAVTRSSTAARVPAGGTCAMLDVRLIFPDSVIATVPWNGCGPAQLVVARPPKFVTDGRGRYTQWRRLPIRVAVRNAGPRRFASAIELRADSLTPFWRGQQLPENASRAFLSSNQLISPQYSAAATAVFGAPRGRSGGLEPGQVSRSFEFTFSPLPQTDHFRVWIDLRRAGASRPYVPEREVKHPPSDTNPLGAEVDAFIASARLPEVHERRALFRMPARDLVIFTVTYGPPQDCGMIMAGDRHPLPESERCIYRGALGLRFGRKVGWVNDNLYLVDPPLRTQWGKSLFRLSSQDQYLLSISFLDTLTTVFGQYHYVAQELTSMVLSYPDVPRATLARLAERVVQEDHIAELLLAHPTVRRDPELLLVLANRPTLEQNQGVRRTARDALLPLAPFLAANPATSARTLFLLATDVPIYTRPGDSLAKRIAEHPNARGDLALQIVTHRTAFLSLVRASPRVRAMLERYLRDDGIAEQKAPLGAQLLADPEAGHNPDVLLALANGSADALVAWEATRRLPPTALLRLETHLMPTLPPR